MEKIMFLSKGWIFLRPAVKSSKKRYIYIYIYTCFGEDSEAQ